MKVEAGIQSQAALADLSKTSRDEDFGLPIPLNHKDLQVYLFSGPATRIEGGGRHLENRNAFPVWNGLRESRRLRK